MKAIAQHYIKNSVEPSMAANYLCLGSGYIDMAKELSNHLYTKFCYEVDIVSYYIFGINIIFRCIFHP